MKKPRRKRCQNCDDLVSPDKWKNGLCDACTDDLDTLLCIVEQYS